MEAHLIAGEGTLGHVDPGFPLGLEAGLIAGKGAADGPGLDGGHDADVGAVSHEIHVVEVVDPVIAAAVHGHRALENGAVFPFVGAAVEFVGAAQRQIPFIGHRRQIEVHQIGGGNLPCGLVQQSLELLHGVHGVVLPVVLVGDDGGDVDVLTDADHVPVLHLDGPDDLGIAGIAGEVQGTYHGGVGGVVCIVAGLPGGKEGGGVLVLDHLHGDPLHQRLKLCPGIGAGGGIVDVPTGGPAVLLIGSALVIDVGGGGAAVVGPGHQQLVGLVPALIVYLAQGVKLLGFIGPVTVPDCPANGGGHHQNQQANQ